MKAVEPQEEEGIKIKQKIYELISLLFQNVLGASKERSMVLAGDMASMSLYG